MKEHESVLVFGANRITYNPIMQERAQSGKARAKYLVNPSNGKREAYNNLKLTTPFKMTDRRYPGSVQKFNVEVGKHPTQKPVALMEYLIKTYSNGGDTVLDFCMGSGTTGVACMNLNREFIGIEKEEDYYIIAKERLLINKE